MRYQVVNDHVALVSRRCSSWLSIEILRERILIDTILSDEWSHDFVAKLVVKLRDEVARQLESVLEPIDANEREDVVCSLFD